MSEKFLLQTKILKEGVVPQSQLMVQDSTIKLKNQMMRSDWPIGLYNKMCEQYILRGVFIK